MAASATDSRISIAPPGSAQLPLSVRRMSRIAPSSRATTLSGRNLDLASCRQADIDAWSAGSKDHARMGVRAFLQWCMASKLARSLRLPPAVIRHAAPLSDEARIRHLGRVLTDRDLPLQVRAAGIIVLLYTHPLTRVVRLTLDDVIRDGDQVLLRLGDPPTPVPGSAAELLLEWTGSRGNMNTATNRNSPWLFPGRMAGQTMNPNVLATLVHDIGIPRSPAGRRRSASTSWACLPPSWPTPSATTPRPPRCWPPRPAAASAATSPETTGARHQG
jgi:hypothetical protein